MELIENIVSMKKCCRKKKRREEKIGLVPTMGALHEGHRALIKKAREDCDFLVVSIFVNPAQFAPGEDFLSYPRNLSPDIELCESEGVDVIFAPPQNELYPDGFSTWVKVEGTLTESLEGAHRPGHFRGVSTVVAKLLNIVFPHCSYFGEKDHQQALVIEKMVKELHIDTQIVLVPTVREEDGLACSSRNRYLTHEERKAALVLYKSLLGAKRDIEGGGGNPSRIVSSMEDLIRKEPLVKIDYIAVVRPENLEPVEKIAGNVVVVLAARIGNTRLIDNMMV